MMKRLHDSHGFTVGELLVAVGIISVLVAIALPLFTSSLADAKDSVDAANCRSARAAATSVCIIDHSGDFSKKSIEEWVQVALDDGIPKRSQVDSSQTLNCKIEAGGTRITFFYGEGSSSGGGTTPGGDPDSGESPSPTPVPTPTPTPTPSGGTVTVERDGVKHTISSDSWSDFPSGTVPQGSVYSDETGTYVFKNQTYVDPSSKSELSNMWDTIKISDSSRVFTNSDIANGKWLLSPPPKKGDIFLSQGVYYVFPRNFGKNDASPDNYIRIDPKYIVTI